MNIEQAEGYDCFPWSPKDIVFLNNKFSLIRYGFCMPHRIVLLKQDREVYLWDRIGDIRQEIFFKESVPSRVYNGNNFSFLEYLGEATKNNVLPVIVGLIASFHEYCQKARPSGIEINDLLLIELSVDVIDMYRRNLEKMLT